MVPVVGTALVIGGGIGGLCTAIALEQAGIDAVVFERKPEIGEVGAGLCLWQNAMHVMRRLKLAEVLVELGHPMVVQENRRWGGEVLERHSFERVSQDMGVPAVTIHRADLHAVLRQHIDPDRLRPGATCIGFEVGDEGVTARFEDRGEYRGAALVGADGIHSAVRRQLLGAEPPRYAGYTCCRGIVPYQPGWFPAGWFVQAIGQGARFGLTHTGRDRVYWWGTFNAPEGSKDAPVGRKNELLQRYGDWAPPVPQIVAATDEAEILRNDIIDRPPNERWGEGPVTLLGDAAHPMTPNMAQGACQAIEDAIVLANCLSEYDDVASALRDYEGRRLDRTALIAHQSWLIGARGQGLLSEEEAPQAMQLADREAALRYVAA